LAEHDAQDVCQETFSAVAKALPTFRRSREGDTFRGWLRTITRSKLADFGRRRRGLPEAVGGSEHLRCVEGWAAREDGGAEPDDETPSGEAGVGMRALELIQGEFEERSWRAFWRTAIDGQKATEVASELDMSPAAVRKAKSRVLNRVRIELKELVDFE
jgi:RNA polymerase sigma-70 factor (ECF subfamily)